MDDFVWSSSCTQDAVFDQFGNLNTMFLAPSGGSSGGGCGGEWEDGKVASASKNHSEAEKRRRDRINAHLATLMKLVSNSEKMDKATLLGKVVEHVKELKSDTTKLSKLSTLPTDLDEVIIDLMSNNTDPGTHVFVKVSISCEDRIDLFSEINHALNSLGLTMVQAEMACLGGRIKCNLILGVTNSTSEAEVTTLKRSLNMLFGRIVSSSSWTTSSNYRMKSKRQRFFCSSNYDTQ